MAINQTKTENTPLRILQPSAVGMATLDEFLARKSQEWRS
jgi:hypothetical protein